MRRTVYLVCAVFLACGDGARTVANVDLEFETPLDGDTVFSLDAFPVRVRAASNEELSKLDLSIGTLHAHTCAPGEEPTEILCELAIDPREWAGQQVDGRLKLTAVVTDADGDTKNTSIHVDVKPVAVSFVQPTRGTVVRGTSNLEVSVRSEVAAATVRVVSEGERPLHSYVGEPYSTEIDWAAWLGAGPHELTAYATDVQGRTATARIQITVACESDGDCDDGAICCPTGLCAVTCD